jgi:polyhydroxyalkanoate synthase
MTNTVLNAALGFQRAAVDKAMKTWQQALAWPKVVDRATHVRVGTSPADVVYEEDTLRLLRYHNEFGVTRREPVLVCYALINRPYILDLQPQRSVVQQLLKGGFDVYLIDWGVPTAADRSMRLEDYVCGLMKNVVGHVLRTAEVPALNLFGYCMGGTMSAMFTALYPETVHTLTLMAAPIDFDADDCLLNLWSQEKYFDVDKLIDAYGNCPAPLLQGSFQAMKPVANYVEKYLNFFDNMHDDAYLENFFAMEKWGQDNIPVAGETFRQFVKCLYQRNQLAKGEFRLNNVPVDLKRITCPTLLLTADADHLVLPKSTLAARRLVGSAEVKAMALKAGHVGLAVSSKAHRQFWPEAVRWIASKSGMRDEG